MNKYTIQKSYSISAGAGSGKTYTLSRRYINAYLGFDLFRFDENTPIEQIPMFFEEKENKKAKIDEIVTMTFTNAAASEMKERIFALMKEILKALNEEIKDLEFIYNLDKEIKNYIKDRLQTALTLSNEAIITTIHGFSLMMIKRYSDYLKLNVDDIIDDLEKESLFEDSFKKALEKYPQIAEILEDISLFKIKTFAKKYIFNPKFKKGFERFENNIDEYKKLIYQFYKIEDSLIINANEEVEGISEWYNELINFKNPILFNQFIEAKIGEKLNYRKKLHKEKYANIRVLRDLLNEEVFIFDIEKENLFKNHLSILKHFLTLTYNEYQTLLADKLDFNKIIIKLHELLDKKEIKFKYVMVDEFQDSNSLQYEIAKKIAKNLFIVGDEKQAIYAFQGGEIEVFKQAQFDLKDKTTITTNYRSDKEIIKFVNEKFKNLFLNEELPIQNDFSATFESLTADSQENGNVEILYFERTEELSEKEVEAKNIANLIYSIVKGEIYPNIKKKYIDNQKPAIGVVYDSKTNMYLLKKELDFLGIPAKINGVEEFWELEEIKDIMAVLKVKSFIYKDKFNDYDRFYITGALNSKIYNYTDEEILKVINNPQKLKEIFIFEEEVLHKFIRKIFISSNAFKRYQNPNSTKANIEEFIREIIILEDIHNYNIHQILKVLEDNFFNGKKTIARYNSPLANSIELSSIHYTKGLAYPVIILTNASKTLSPNRQDGAIDTKYNQNNYLIGFKINDYAPLTYRVADYIDKLKYLEEKKRLLYVALTRAKHNIVISTKKEYKENSYSYWIDANNLKEVKPTEITSNLNLQEEIMIDNFEGEFDDKIELPDFSLNSNFGEAVHRAIELYSDNFSDEKIAKISDFYGVAFKEIKKMIDNFINSDEYKELQKATIKNFEWEFEDEDGVGRIDLWYEIEGVCKIVDFKTGQPKKEHTIQINRYKKALQKIGYKNITTKLLYLGEKK